MPKWDKCPKCQGLLHLDRDEYGWYMECFMCGFTQDMKEYSAQKTARAYHETVADKQL